MNREEKVIIDGYPVVKYTVSKDYNSGSYRGLKLFLLEKYKICWWCGVFCIDFVPRDGENNPPENMATIDHLVSRSNRLKGQSVPKVLCCYSCNEERGKKRL